MLRVPFSDAALDVRMERVEVPLPVGPPLLPEEIQRESQSRVRPVPQGGHEIEADEHVVVVMGRVVESVPRRVLGSLLVQFLPQVVLGPELDRALHALGPILSGIHREGAHALPRVQVPTTSKTTPTAVLVPILDKPLERPADRRMIRVTKIARGRALCSRSRTGGPSWNHPWRTLHRPWRIVRARGRTPS